MVTAISCQTPWTTTEKWLRGQYDEVGGYDLSVEVLLPWRTLTRESQSRRVAQIGHVGMTFSDRARLNWALVDLVRHNGPKGQRQKAGSLSPGTLDTYYRMSFMLYFTFRVRPRNARSHQRPRSCTRRMARKSIPREKQRPLTEKLSLFQLKHRTPTTILNYQNRI